MTASIYTMSWGDLHPEISTMIGLMPTATGNWSAIGDLGEVYPRVQAQISQIFL